MYSILEQAFSKDAMERLFSSQNRPASGQMFSAGNCFKKCRIINNFVLANLNQMLNFLPGPVAQQAATSRNRGNRNLITNEMFANALQSLGGGPVSTSSGSGSNNTSSSSQPAQNSAESLTEVYAAQLTQLHDFGFTNDDENILALTEANGDVELALEIIIRNREEND